ncbi:hypothetical protein [Deinococcus aquatilis]|uniref:hypothetical protein n=1 Tax=Deinococcus aquatilis TaxID=519440 RepID=UPI000377120B|nr:hypothetical protein [Deinococcus aquatilis]
MITAAQTRAIQAAHADGLLDADIAQRAQVSISTVKRVRRKLGLATHCKTARRGRLGEQQVAASATARGLSVVWRARDDDKYDLWIEGKRVDAKATLQGRNGTWHFRLPVMRSSFLGRYAYEKDYERDCEVVALVCQFADGRSPIIYLLGSANLPASVRIREGVNHIGAREAWEVFAPSESLLAA